MNFIYKLLAKYLGPKVYGRAASSLVVAIADLIGKYIPKVDPELLSRWSGDTIELLSLGIGVVVALFMDYGITKGLEELKKPEVPKVVAE